MDGLVDPRAGPGRTSTRWSRSGRTIRTSSPVSSRTSRRAVSSVVSAGLGVPFGRVQVTPSRSRSALADDQLGRPVDEPDDDATGRGGGRPASGGPRRRHGGAPRPSRPASSLSTACEDAGSGRPLAPGEPARSISARHGARSAVSGPTSGRRSTVRRPGAAMNAGDGTEAETPLAGPGRRMDEPSRPGRVTVRRCCAASRHRTASRDRAASAVGAVRSDSGDKAPRCSGDPRRRARAARGRRQDRPGRLRAERRRGGRAIVPASPRVAGPGERRGDAEGAGVGHGLLEERQVDPEGALLVEARSAARPRGSCRAARRPARREHRRGVVGRLRARGAAEPGRPRSPRPCPRGARPARRRPRSRSSRRGAPRAPGRGRRTRPAGETRPPGSRRPSPARAPRRRGAPLVWIIAWPAYRRRLPASDSTTSSGTARITSSTSSTRALGSANARTPGTRSLNRSRRAGSRDATAPTGQPARLSATPSAVPTAPAPTIPTTGRSPGPECACGCAWSLACSTSPWRCVVPAPPSRRRPARRRRRRSPGSRRSRARRGRAASPRAPRRRVARPGGGARPRSRPTPSSGAAAGRRAACALYASTQRV